MINDLNWEDETRLTFMELSKYMDKNAHPLDSIIDFAWASGADRFWVNNAKDELKKLKQELEFYKQSFETPVAWAKTNEHNDLFDLRIQNNPYANSKILVPLYRKKDT